MTRSTFLGILSLDTAFPRILGDAGNPESYPCPACLRIVEGADSTLVVTGDRPEPALLARFIAAAQSLEADGAFALTSTCGFLITAQKDIADAVGIPVAVSALTMLPMLQAVHGTGQIGILTASAEKLGARALAASGGDPTRVVIGGMEGEPAFRNAFLAAKAAQSTAFDRAAMEAAVCVRAKALTEEHPDIRALLLECGNLPPYTETLRATLRRPVYSVLDLSRLLQAGSVGRAAVPT